MEADRKFIKSFPERLNTYHGWSAKKMISNSKHPRAKQISESLLIPSLMPDMTEMVARAVITHMVITCVVVLYGMSGLTLWKPAFNCITPKPRLSRCEENHVIVWGPKSNTLFVHIFAYFREIVRKLVQKFWSFVTGARKFIRAKIF